MSLYPPVPCLWFNMNAEDAANYYVAHLGAKIGKISRYGEGTPMPAGTAMMVEFEILGQVFCGLNGGPHYTQSPAVSFILECDTQDDIDRLWAVFSEGGRPMQCGWITDQFGVTWQVTPRKLAAWMTSGDGAGIGRVMAAFMPMVKLNLATLEAAFEGRD
jgi:predicted 3-demethylubiquinone-9 3-methyltransferase (glyoxalase superfamily)